MRLIFNILLVEYVIDRGIIGDNCDVSVIVFFNIMLVELNVLEIIVCFVMF